MNRSFTERYAPILVTARLNGWELIKAFLAVLLLFTLIQIQIMWNLPVCSEPTKDGSFWAFWRQIT